MITPLPPIAELLPHTGRAILLDTIEAADASSISCTLHVRPECPFFIQGKGVSAHVSIEWMALACAAYGGLEDRVKGKPVTLGLLLGTRNFKATRPYFAPGLDFIIEARLSYRDAAIGVFDCSVRQRGSDILDATAQLTVYQPEDVRAFLEEQGQ